MTAEMIMQIAAAAVGAFGFGLLFRVSGEMLLTVTIGGAANWIFYLLAMEVYADRVLAFFLSAWQLLSWRKYWHGCLKRRLSPC